MDLTLLFLNKGDNIIIRGVVAKQGTLLLIISAKEGELKAILSSFLSFAENSIAKPPSAEFSIHLLLFSFLHLSSQSPFLLIPD